MAFLRSLRLFYHLRAERSFSLCRRSAAALTLAFFAAFFLPSLASAYIPNVFLDLFDEKPTQRLELQLLLSEKALPSKIVQSLSPLQATLLRNAIFALHGSTFRSPHYRSFFKKQPWYKGLHSPSRIALSDIERKNVAALALQGKSVPLYTDGAADRPPPRPPSRPSARPPDDERPEPPSHRPLDDEPAQDDPPSKRPAPSRRPSQESGEPEEPSPRPRSSKIPEDPPLSSKPDTAPDEADDKTPSEDGEIVHKIRFPPERKLLRWKLSPQGFSRLFRQAGRLHYIGWTLDSRFFLYKTKFEVDCNLYASAEEPLEGTLEIELATILEPKVGLAKTFLLSSKEVKASPPRSSKRSRRSSRPNPCSRRLAEIARLSTRTFFPKIDFARWQRGKRFQLLGSALSPRGGWIAKASAWPPPARPAPSPRPDEERDERPTPNPSLPFPRQTFLISMHLLEGDTPVSSGISFFQVEKSPLRPPRRLTSFWSPNGAFCLWILTEARAKTSAGTQDQIQHTLFLSVPPLQSRPLLRIAASPPSAASGLRHIEAVARKAEALGFSVELLSHPGRPSRHTLQAPSAARSLVSRLQPSLPHKTRVRFERHSKPLLLLLGSFPSRLPPSLPPPLPWNGPSLRL